VATFSQGTRHEHILLHILSIITNKLDPSEGTVAGHVGFLAIFHSGVNHLDVRVLLSLPLMAGDPSDWEIYAFML
jgi:hypothetical protein